MVSKTGALIRSTKTKRIGAIKQAPQQITNSRTLPFRNHTQVAPTTPNNAQDKTRKHHEKQMTNTSTALPTSTTRNQIEYPNKDKFPALSVSISSLLIFPCYLTIILRNATMENKSCLPQHLMWPRQLPRTLTCFEICYFKGDAWTCS